MYVASMAPDNSASVAAGPALNVAVLSLLAPSASWKKPFFTPTIALAWVKFGKYPRCTVNGFAVVAVVLPLGALTLAATPLAGVVVAVVAAVVEVLAPSAEVVVVSAVVDVVDDAVAATLFELPLLHATASRVKASG